MYICQKVFLFYDRQLKFLVKNPYTNEHPVPSLIGLSVGLVLEYINALFRDFLWFIFFSIFITAKHLLIQRVYLSFCTIFLCFATYAFFHVELYVVVSVTDIMCYFSSEATLWFTLSVRQSVTRRGKWDLLSFCKR